MVATVGSISIDLSTNAGKFEAGFKRAATTVDRESARMAKAVGGFHKASALAGSVISGFVGGIAAGGALAAVTSLSAALGKARQALSDFDEIANNARTVGLRTDAYQAISFGALEAGVDQEKLNAALGIFAKNVGLAQQGTGALASGLKTLNPELLRALLSTTDQEKRLKLVADAMLQTEDATKRAALATTVFGKGGIELVRVLDRGGAALEEFKRRGKELGVIIPDDLLQKSGELDDKLEVLAKVVDVNISTALVHLAPLLVASAEGMAAFAKEINDTATQINDFIENPSLEKFIDFLGGASEGERNFLLGIRDYINGMAESSKRTTEDVKADIAEIEQKIFDLIQLGDEWSLFNAEKLAEDAAFLKQELAGIEAAALSTAAATRAAFAQQFRASENASMAALEKFNRERYPSSGNVDQGSGVGVTRFGQETADNTERTADYLEDQSSAFEGYFTDLDETLRNDVTGGITKYIEQLIDAQEFASQSLSESVRTGIVSGMNDSIGSGRQYTSDMRSSSDPTRLLENQIEYLRAYQPTVTGSFASEHISQQIAKLELQLHQMMNPLDVGIGYAGAFADGGSFIAPGNQTGDTTRLLMDVNGGEKVTVTPAGGGSSAPITLNVYPSAFNQGETEEQWAKRIADKLQRAMARR